MSCTALHPSAVTRLLHLLQAAQPFLTPSWSRLVDLCIRLLYLSDLFSNPEKTDVTHLLHDIRGCTPSNDMDALLCAIRPFCLERELQMLQMYEQFQQMQKAMEMWKIFSDIMPDMTDTTGTDFSNLFSGFMNIQSPVSESETASGASAPDSASLLAFLTPEQLSLYNSILADTAET